MIANREAYGQALVKLYETNKNIVALDADLAKATYSEIFHKAHPEAFIECGIAEQNMMGVAAGMSTSGLIPFVSTFAVFASIRAGEQFRNSVCYPHLNVKVVGTHAGIECGADGATHQALEDVALMRTMPGNHVFVPADPKATEKLVFEMARIDGPCYMRVGRDKMPDIYDDSFEFKVGGSHKLRDGQDVAILAMGSRVKAALDAADSLKSQGINASVYDMYSLKPLDEKAVEEASKCGLIVTCEDHNIIGGLGSAVCECICSLGLGCKVVRMGVQDSFGRSGPASELYKLYHIDTDDIVSAVIKNISK